MNSPLRNKTALQELCLHSDGSQSRGALEDTIQALNDAECNVWADHGGRSALFLALDNLQSPVEVTGALLRVFTWEYVNDRRTVFKTAPSTDGNKLVFSPTMYLDSKYYRGKREYVSELRELLYSAQAIDRCYMEIGPGALDAIQPKGAVNVPIDIAEEDERRRAIRYVQRADAIEARLQRKTESQKAASDWATRTDSRIDDQHEYQLSGVTQQQKPSQPETTSTQKMSIAPRWHAQQEQQVMVSHQNRVAQQRATSDLQMKALHRKQAVIVPRQRTEELRTFAMFSYAPKRYHS